MRVYRIISFEGSPVHIAEQLRLFVNGTYCPGQVKITSAAVEPRIVESTPMLMHALALAGAEKWEPPKERQPPGKVVGTPSAGDLASALEFVRHIEDLIDDERYEWASDTLIGIRDTITRTDHVTDRQREAVDNIENARRRP